MGKEWLITGIPRSGTTLLTNLISQDQGFLCFSEPAFIKNLKQQAGTAPELAALLAQKLTDIRSDIKAGIPVSMRVPKHSGDQLDNYFKRQSTGGQNTTVKSSEHQDVTLPKSYHDRTLVVKNNLLFTACLEDLSERFRVTAIVRNPISAIGSWNSLDIPVSRGQVVTAEQYNKRVKSVVNSQELLKRQIQIYQWFCGEYIRLQQHIQIIRYEDLVEDPHNTLQPCGLRLDPLLQLSSKNNSVHYDEAVTQQLMQLFQGLSESSEHRHFYPDLG